MAWVTEVRLQRNGLRKCGVYTPWSATIKSAAIKKHKLEPSVGKQVHLGTMMLRELHQTHEPKHHVDSLLPDTQGINMLKNKIKDNGWEQGNAAGLPQTVRGPVDGRREGDMGRAGDSAAPHKERDHYRLHLQPSQPWGLRLCAVWGWGGRGRRELGDRAGHFLPADTNFRQGGRECGPTKKVSSVCGAGLSENCTGGCGCPWCTWASLDTAEGAPAAPASRDQGST